MILKNSSVFIFLICAFFISAGCDENGNGADDEAVSDETQDETADEDDVDDSDTVPEAISEMKFGSFGPWAAPVEDYLDFAAFYEFEDYVKDISDLAVNDGKMWFGYGDANLNFGTKLIDLRDSGIQFRYFESPDNPEAQKDLMSGDEMIDHYRVFNEGIWYAGVDSTDQDELTSRPSIGGNFYRHDSDGWKKFRSIPGGEHVHDAAFFKGRVFTVGSGAADRTEWEAGNIFRYLWVSDDMGETFAVAHRIGHPEQGGAGDSRFVHLLVAGDTLYLFGYWSDFEANQAYVANAYYDGKNVTEFTASDNSVLKGVWPTGTLSLPDGTGLVWGVNVDTSVFKYQAWHVKADGVVEELSSFAGSMIADAVYDPEMDEIVFMTFKGDAYTEPVDPVEASVYAADAASPGDIKKIAEYSGEIRPVSIAYWKGALFMGTDDCRIFKAVPEK